MSAELSRPRRKTAWERTKDMRNVLGLAIGLGMAAVLAAAAAASTIYVSNEKSNTITVVDGDTLEVVLRRAEHGVL